MRTGAGARSAYRIPVNLLGLVFRRDVAVVHAGDEQRG
jgi:hypothetical protein